MIITSQEFPYALRHKVTLEQPVSVEDGAGGQVVTWEKVASLWAEIRRMRGGESFTHGEVAASGTYLFRIRYRSGVTPTMRFNYDGRLFNIRSIHNVKEEARALDIIAEEGFAL